jgi:hypothetical protein
MLYYKKYSPGGPIKDTAGRTYHLYRGKTSEIGKEYYHKWLGMNTFSEIPEKIPEKAFRIKGPSKKALKDCIYDSSKKQAVKVYIPERSKDLCYMIHSGCKRPFIVYISRIFKDVYVYQIPSDRYVPDMEWSKNFSDNIGYYSQLVVEIYSIEVFPGVDHCPSQAFGNTVLIMCKDRRYVYIGPTIYTFDVDEDIYAYFSPLDRDDIPRPVAVGKNRLYLCDCKRSISRSNFPDLNIKTLGETILDFRNFESEDFRNIKILVR